MLPSSLLRVWKRKGTIWPQYAKISTENIEAADRLIRSYTAGLGKKKKALKETVSELEETEYPFQFVRGLSFLLDQRSIFKCISQIESSELRRRVFQLTGKTGPATTNLQRKKILQEISLEIKRPIEAIDASLYADLKDELILEEFVTISPEELLRKYNLSLTQTLLFDSTEMNFTVSENWQKIFFLMKRAGLIYEAYKEDGFWIKIDGPASLFKLTRRYGTAIARIIPGIIASFNWRIKAKILWKYSNEILDFEIESKKHSALFETYQTSQSYDSDVEHDFAQRFQALDSGWILKREPEPVIVGKQVIIPDFSFEKGGIRLYMEIVGFWTREYLLRKIEKLKKIGVDMLVAVDENLACQRLTNLEKQPQLRLIYYRGKIPLSPVIQYLQESFSKEYSKQLEFLRNLSVTFTEPIVKFEDFAARVGVYVEAVRRMIADNPPSGYIILPAALIAKQKIEEIRKNIEREMGDSDSLPLQLAGKLVKEEGLDITSIAEAMGFKIVWHGIDVQQAQVVRNQNNKKNEETA